VYEENAGRGQGAESLTRQYFRRQRGQVSRAEGAFMAKVSVIIPVYNTEKYISRCVDSVLGQTFTDFELIAVDDGSSDHSPELLDGYAEKDNRVKVVHQENLGLSAARNKGLSIASGEYIAFIDSDDWVHPRYLEVLTDMMAGSGAEIAVCGFKYVWGEADQEYALSGEYSLIKAAEYMGSWIFSDPVWARIYNKKVINGISFSNLENEDRVFNFDVFALHPDILTAVTDSTGYYYFQREGSLQSRFVSGSLRYFRYFHHAEYYYSRFLGESDPDIKKKYLMGARSSILQYLPHRNDNNELSRKHSREFRALMKSINRALPLFEANKRKRILFSSYCYFPFLYELNLWLHRNNK
jgi:glycosyltransferase involved in cell wall biosynthesis